jgi:hypothetical protein
VSALNRTYAMPQRSPSLPSGACSAQWSAGAPRPNPREGTAKTQQVIMQTEQTLAANHADAAADEDELAAFLGRSIGQRLCSFHPSVSAYALPFPYA